MDYDDDLFGKSNIIISTTEDGLSKIKTTFDGDTVCLLTKWQNCFREINQQFQGILKIFIQKKNLCRKQLLHILQQFKMKETGR